jgi:hypothetical protein
MPAGLYHTVLASSATAAPPANALPMPEPPVSWIWKNAAEAGAEMQATARNNADRRKKQQVRDFMLLSLLLVTVNAKSS